MKHYCNVSIIGSGKAGFIKQFSLSSSIYEKSEFDIKLREKYSKEGIEKITADGFPFRFANAVQKRSFFPLAIDIKENPSISVFVKDAGKTLKNYEVRVDFIIRPKSKCRQR